VSVKELVRPNAIGGSRLVRDYLDSVPSALSFYGGPPFRLDTFRLKLDEVSRRFDRSARERAARTLRPTRSGGDERLRRFVEEGGAVVTTGQQAGFLTGPLYTIYKAISCIALARHLEERLGVIVLPVFWIASEDHDWAEVREVVVADRNGRLREFQLPSEDERALPMSDRRLEGALDPLLDEIGQYIGGDKHNGDYVKRILDAYRAPEQTVADAFREAIGAVFCEFDLFLADAADPILKDASRPILEQALLHASRQEAALTERSAALEAAGYSTQVGIVERGTNVFLRTAAGRDRLYRRADGFATRERGGVYTEAELLEELQANPGRFSPNVLLRPVVESTFYPTLGYAGGPGEVAYFAQVNALFGEYGVAPPVVVPRFSATVVEASIGKTLDSLQLTEVDLKQQKDALVERLARREIPPRVASSLDHLRASGAAAFAELLDASQEVDPTLVGALGAIRNRALVGAAQAERKIIRALKRREAFAGRKLERVLEVLRPRGEPQDRVLNVLPFLSRYSIHFLREVERSLTHNWRFPSD
jgi:bacillithiol synthase